ncbi:MAG TPA: LLM class flavin-dependent oxidoreductase, partial [Ilumatobacteraceae bacterium]
YQGLFTFARPVQERLPVKIGSMRGPKSFEVAGEVSDGCHHALSYTRAAYEYGFEHFRNGAERAGKDPNEMDFGAWVVVAVGRDSAAAKQAARSMVGIYASSMPHEQLRRNGVDPDELAPIVDAIGGGDLAKGIELTSPELADRLSISGTPDEVTAKIRAEIEGTGVNHVIAAITDASLVKAFTGQSLDGVATVEEQLRLLAEDVMPSFR